MKAIHGRLNMRLKYEFVELIDAPVCATTCDNCRKPIRNIVVLKDSKGNFYNVGTDCAKVIVDANIKYLDGFSGYFAFLEAQKELRRAKKFDLFVRKHLFKTIKKNGATGEGVSWIRYLLCDRHRFVQYHLSEEEFLALCDSHRASIEASIV